MQSKVVINVEESITKQSLLVPNKNNDKRNSMR